MAADFCVTLLVLIVVWPLFDWINSCTVTVKPWLILVISPSCFFPLDIVDAEFTTECREPPSGFGTNCDFLLERGSEWSA